MIGFMLYLSNVNKHSGSPNSIESNHWVRNERRQITKENLFTFA